MVRSLGFAAAFVAAFISLYAKEPCATEDTLCNAEARLKLKKPIRLLSRSEIKAAGNYREIPLAASSEAALSERASDVLQKQTGVEVNRAGAPGTQSVLGIRGSSPEQVEYFLEGMPLPKPYNAPLNLETLPLALFKSVDIFPSFIPSHLPATNIGGAMDFHLREVDAACTEYLTQFSATSLLGVGISAARLTETSLHFVNLEGSRNRYFYTKDNGTPSNLQDDATKERTNEDFSRIGYTSFARAEWSRWKFSGLLDLNHSERGLPGVANQELKKVRKKDDRFAAAFAAERPLGAIQHVAFFATTALDASTIEDTAHELFYSTGQKSISPQVIGGGSYAVRTDSFDAALSIRGKYQTIILNDARNAERSEAQAAVNAAYDKTFFRLAAQMNATANRDQAAASLFFASAPQMSSQAGLGASLLAALRPLYFFKPEADRLHTTKTLELYAQVSQAYRPPSLYERFGDNVFVTPSLSLKSENALTNAAGVRGAFPCFLALVCSIRSEVFLTGAKDYILFTQNSARTLIAVNASSAQIFGVENEALLNWPERFLLSLRYTYLDARDYGNIPYYQDKYLPLRPRHHAVAVLTLFYKNFRTIASVEYRGAVFRDRYNSYFFYLPSKTLADFGMDYIYHSPAGVRHTLNFTVKNIFDNRDVDIIGYTVPGRYFLVKWTAEW